MKIYAFKLVINLVSIFKCSTILMILMLGFFQTNSALYSV